MDDFRKQIEDGTGLMRRDAGTFMPRRAFLKKAGIFVAGAASLKAINLATDEVIVRGVESIAERPLLTHTYASTDLGFRYFEEDSSDAQKAGMESYEQSIAMDGLPDWVQAVATPTKFKDGEQWVISQGEGIGLWANRPRDIPMSAQPDPDYGRWCSQRFRTASLTQQRVGPRYQRCECVVYTDDGARQRAVYDVLLLPYANGDVVSITKRIALHTLPG